MVSGVEDAAYEQLLVDNQPFVISDQSKVIDVSQGAEGLKTPH